MEIEDTSRLVQFLSNWAAVGPWKHELRISGNERTLCEAVFPSRKETFVDCDPLWKRIFSMRLSKLRGLCKRNKRRLPIAGEAWVMCPAQSALGFALRAGAKWNILGGKYGNGIALLVKLPDGFLEYNPVIIILSLYMLKSH